MSDHPKIAAEVQKLEGDALIELFVLDLTDLGGSTFPFHNERVNGVGTIGFGGVTYHSIPFKAEGYAFNGTEQNAQPKIYIGAIGGQIRALAREFDDFTGAKLKRLRTFRRHLDDGSDPDGTAMFQADVFSVDRKESENKLEFQFALGSSLDVFGMLFPGRKCLSRCQWRYKSAECGYSGGLPTCKHTPEDCEIHFGAGNPLPYGGFPGLEHYREL